MILVQLIATAAALMVSAVVAIPAQTQNSRPTATLCVPNELLKYREVWDTPYPGGKIDVFKRAIAGYIAANGDPRVQYRIKPDALDRFDPQTSTLSDVFETVETADSCPANTTRYLVEFAAVQEQTARQEAAQRVPSRAHYQFLFGRVLMAAKRNQDAAIAFAGAHADGDAMSTWDEQTYLNYGGC